MSLGGFVAPEGRTDDPIGSVATHERREPWARPGQPTCHFLDDGIPQARSRTRKPGAPQNDERAAPGGATL